MRDGVSCGGCPKYEPDTGACLSDTCPPKIFDEDQEYEKSVGK